ncbi:hypothetical protein K488DRAFT_89138 [Vararia minispora EC-137]|uniref:Uncharacterized protein n=1 Tax=Vararia minispora EC-137 TaxID=1314806 RepID=A0ACB8QBS0_9AGAM|nr:hypothetical protein K488DRAFT_89138 [Vararia minispora EC-137]
MPFPNHLYSTPSSSSPSPALELSSLGQISSPSFTSDPFLQASQLEFYKFLQRLGQASDLELLQSGNKHYMLLREQVNTLQAAKTGLEAEIEGLRHVLDRAHAMAVPAPMPVTTAVQNDPDSINIPNQILDITIPELIPPSPCRDDYKSVTYWYKCTWNKARGEQKGISQDGPRRRGGWNLANDVVKALAFLQHEDGDMISADEAKAINTDTRLLLGHLLNIGICPITLSDPYNHSRVNTIIVAVLEGKHSCISLCDKNWKAHEVLSTVFSSFKQSNETEIYEQRMWRRLRPNAANDAKSRRVRLQQEREERERSKRSNSEDAPTQPARKKQKESNTTPLSISAQPSASSPLVISQPISAHSRPASAFTESENLHMVETVSAELVVTSAEPGVAFTKPAAASAKLIATSAKPATTSAESVVTSAEPVIASAELLTVSAKPVAISTELVATSAEPDIASADSEPLATFARLVTASTELLPISAKPVVASPSIDHLTLAAAWRALYNYISADDNAATLTEHIERIIGNSYQYSDWRDAYNIVELDSDDTDYDSARNKLLALAEGHGITLSDILAVPAPKSPLLPAGDRAEGPPTLLPSTAPIAENLLDKMEFQFNVDLEVAESQTAQPEAAPADPNARVRSRKNRKPLGLLSNENAENQGRREYLEECEQQGKAAWLDEFQKWWEPVTGDKSKLKVYQDRAKQFKKAQKVQVGMAA